MPCCFFPTLFELAKSQRFLFYRATGVVVAAAAAVIVAVAEAV